MRSEKMSLKKMLENFDVKGSIEARIHYYNFRLESEISEITDRKQKPFTKNNLIKSIALAAPISFIVTALARYLFNPDYFSSTLFFILSMPFFTVFIVRSMNRKKINQAWAKRLIDYDGIFKDVEAKIGSKEEYLSKDLVDNFLIKNNLFNEPRKLTAKALEDGMIDRINPTEFFDKLKESNQTSANFVLTLNDQAVDALHKEVIRKIETYIREKVGQYFLTKEREADERVKEIKRIRDEKKQQEALAIKRSEENSAFVMSKFEKNLAL